MALFVIGLLLASGASAARTVHDDSSTARNESGERELQATNLTGLPNAISHVRNNETRDHLLSVWSKIAAKQQAHIAALEIADTTTDGDGNTHVFGKASVKYFGFIPGHKGVEYVVGTDGSVERVKHWDDYLYSLDDGVSS